jgi:hypothetical protein
MIKFIRRRGMDQRALLYELERERVTQECGVKVSLSLFLAESHASANRKGKREMKKFSLPSSSSSSPARLA